MTSRQRFLLRPDPAGIPHTKPYKDSDPQIPSTYFSRTNPSEVAYGQAARAEHHLERPKTAVVGVDAAPYPAAGGFHADATALATMNGPSALGYDIEAVEAVGGPQPQANKQMSRPLDISE